MADAVSCEARVYPLRTRRMSQPTRYRATIAYVGTEFHGWQRQKNAPRTVQAVLEAALAHLARAPVRLEGASRTDAGVHADGQVAHFDLPRRRDPRAVRDAINGRLSEDVRVLAVEETPPGFHARFDAGWKEYVYRWSRAEVIAPRDRPFVARISPRADAERLREAASLVAGERDFRVFAVTPRAGESTVRNLHSITVRERGAELAGPLPRGRVPARHGALDLRRAFGHGAGPCPGGPDGPPARNGRPEAAFPQGRRARTDALPRLLRAGGAPARYY